MKPFFGYVESLPDRPKFFCCLLLSLLLGVINYITGDYSLSLFYVLPIAFASWFIGKSVGLYIALLCSIELYFIQLSSAPGQVSMVSLRSWNALMEVGYLNLTAYLISVVRAEMEQSKQRAIELELLNQELSAFNYTVAHDLRSPLVWIGGYCLSILKHHSDRLNDEPREHLREVCEGTHRMEQLIATLLEFSQLAQRELTCETVNLSELVYRVAEDFVKIEPGRQATFRIVEGIMTVGDQHLLRVVIENLLGNAWKYTGEQEEAVIEFGVTKYKGKRAYFVRDNGAGFDMASAGKLFAPFQRLHDSERFKGHGVGLATVKRIINMHNGEIWAESRVGEGTAFYFTLKDGLTV